MKNATLIGFITVLLNVTFCIPLAAEELINDSKPVAFGVAEMETVITEDGDFLPSVNAFATYPLLERLSVYSFVLTTQTWSQGLLGFHYSPAPWIAFTVGGGMEAADTLWRTAASVWVGNKDASLFGVYEKGGSGYFYKVLGRYVVSDYVGLGLFLRRFTGLGPYAEINIPHTPFTLWSATTYGLEGEGFGGVVGLRLSF